MPEKAKPTRADRLWRQTCFEAFLRGAQHTSYWEFNFSPSLQWGAYRFDRYREGVVAQTTMVDPGIELQLGDCDLRLSAALNLSGIAELRADDDWRLGLSAVIEDRDGGRSYWALAHPPGQPDFHHYGNFLLHVPANPRRS